jgi:hypothetical protein
VETVTTNLVRCDRPSCLKPVPAAKAIWYTDYDIAYCSNECEQADSEFRAALEPLEITHKRLDCVYNLSLCCIAPIDTWGRCSKCNKWACGGAVI